VLGICNGFQVLCECGLLPGALMRNAALAFQSRPVDVRIESTDTPFTSAYEPGQIVRLPVAHGDGRYVTSERELAELADEGRIVMRYVRAGMPDAPANPNGSAGDVAAVSSASGTVVGMMPHPERVADARLGSTDGLGFFLSLAAWAPAPAST
jgi:phosphoribosylformylglycinamidine synthase